MKCKNLKKSAKLAEIIGIMMGDGCLYLDRLNKYQTSISLGKEERPYLYYVKDLFENYFKYKFCITEIKHGMLLRNTSVFVGNQLINFGIKAENKIKNKIEIPYWIMQNNNYLINCIRGLFDTDGCVYCKYDNYAQIQFKFGGKELLDST